MTEDAHAKRLGLLLQIYAGVLSVSVALSLISFVYFYGSWFDRRMVPSVDDLSLEGPYAYTVWLMLAVLGGLVLGFIFMLVTIVVDFRLGKRLRSGIAGSPRSIVVASTFNIASGLLGGILLFPLGTALGVYGLWYRFSSRKTDPEQRS